MLFDLHDDIAVEEAHRVEAGAPPPHAIPDLVLLDLHLPGLCELEALDVVRSRYEGAAVVVLSSEEDPLLIRDCIERGAAGFIPESSSPEVLIHALRLVLVGGIYLPNLVLGSLVQNIKIARRLTGGPRSTADPVERVIIGRPLQALMHAVRGKSNKVIAREMDIAEATVKLHLSNAFRVLGVTNRTEAVFRVAELGLVELEQ